MSTRTSSTALAATLLVAGAAAALSSNGVDHDLSWRTVDGGGGESSGGTFAVQGTIGQPDAGATMIGGIFEITGGFWSASGATPPCPADLDGDDIVGFTDLVMLLAAWGACPDCPEDLNGDNVVDFTDLVILLASYGPCAG